MKSTSGWNAVLRARLFATALWSSGLTSLVLAAGAQGEPDQLSSVGELEWLVAKPIPVLRADGSSRPPGEPAQKKAFDDDLLFDRGGEASLNPKLGDKITVNGVDAVWQTADGNSRQPHNLQAPGPGKNFVIAYAAAEFDAPAEAKVLLGIGSDDHVKVWLNGKLVHQNWIRRPVDFDTDVVPVTVKAGKNHLLLKIQNGTGGWGFACRVMTNEMIAAKLASAARNGDLDTLKALLDSGADVNAVTSFGLNAYHAARLAGQASAVEFLTQHGADPQSPAPLPEKWVDALFTSHVLPGDAGAAVLISRDGKILLERGYGMADLEAGRTITPTTKFRIGSITKQFTAAAILKLEEQGKLQVTDPLSKYYPDFPRGAEVTLHHLLTHTSGIHSYTDDPDFIGKVGQPIAADALVASIQKNSFDFNPGDKWAYCNSGYFLLGTIVEQVSRQSYQDFLRQTFFEPLGMVNTGVYRNDAPPKDIALGYGYEADNYKKALDWEMSWAGGAGALYSTVEDLSRWNDAVFSGKVLSPTHFESAFTPVKTKENKDVASDIGYGYGWSIMRLRGDLEFAHGGGLSGFSTFLLRLPHRGLSVVVLSNALPAKPGLSPGNLAQDVAEIYLGHELAEVPKNPEATAVSDTALAAIVGGYDAGGAVMEVVKEGNRVFVQLTGQPRFELFPKSDTEFFLKAVKAEITFTKDAAGKVTKAVNHQNGQIMIWPRLEPTEEIKLEGAKLDAVTGEYDYRGGKILTVTREGDRLYAQLTNQPRFEIFAESETEFFWKVVAARLALVKDDHGKVIKAIHHQGGQKLEVTKIK